MNSPERVDGGRRLRNRLVLLTVSLFCGAYSVLFAIVLPTALLPELQDPIFVFRETAIIRSMDALRIIHARSGVRSYAFDEHGVLTFRSGDTTLSEEALLRRYQDLSPAVGQIRARVAPCSAVWRLNDGACLCQHWHRGGQIGGWATWGNTGVGEAMRLQVSMTQMGELPWFWWSASENALTSR